MPKTNTARRVGTRISVLVRTLAAGKTYFDPALPVAAARSTRRIAGKRVAGALTATEDGILRLVAEGKSNPEIAVLIGLTRRTVETYRLRLMRKLGIEDLPSLVRHAIREGIIPLD